MGLGKTLQTISVLLYAKDRLGADASAGLAGPAGAKEGVKSNGSNAPTTQAQPAPQLDLFAQPAEDEVFLQPLRALIVLPASLVFNWRNELERFAPSLTVQSHTGQQRNKDPRVLRRFDVLLTTYQTALRDIDILREIDFSYVVLDESQQIKNRQSKVFKALNELNAVHRISLSGTPIENSLSDLWSQMQFINPAHQSEIGIGYWARLVIYAAPTDPEQRCLLADAEFVITLDHRFALGNRPALSSAPDKKSFSSASWPIFACNSFTSTGRGASC